MPATQWECIYGGLTPDMDRHYIESVTATTHQKKRQNHHLKTNVWCGHLLNLVKTKHFLQLITASPVCRELCRQSEGMSSSPGELENYFFSISLISVCLHRKESKQEWLEREESKMILCSSWTRFYCLKFNLASLNCQSRAFISFVLKYVWTWRLRSIFLRGYYVQFILPVL